MTKTLLSLALATLALLPAPLAGQQEVLQEKVAVVNVEVPVRVFLDGKPLDGLSKDDFRLSEGGQEQAINGFLVRRKRLALERIELRPEAAPPPPRYFVLVFRIYEYSDAMRAAMDRLFVHVLDERDRLLVLVNDRTLPLTPALGLGERRARLDELLGEEAGRSRQRLEQFFLAVKHDLDQTRLRMLLERDASFFAPRIIDFLDRYRRTWEEFKSKYLVPDLDKFYNFARHLETVREEKWVLSFFQIELFPNMKISGRIHKDIEQLVSELQVDRPEDTVHARIIEKQLENIDRALNAAEGFPVDEISKMLVKVDTSYHCFIMGLQREAQSEDLEYKQVASDIEGALREITRRSGGDVVFSADVGSALHAVEEREDVYYVLTYEPRRPAARGRVKVELPGRPAAKLFYDDNIRADYIGDYLKRKRAEDPEILLDNLALDGHWLRLKISSFKMALAGRKREGALNVKVRIRDAQGRPVYDQSRQLSAREARVELAIDFTCLAPGRYLFLVEAGDRLTGKTAMDVLAAQVE